MESGLNFAIVFYETSYSGADLGGGGPGGPDPPFPI